MLLLRLSALGDVVHALPALGALRRLLPGVEVDWAVEDRTAPLLEGVPGLRRVHVFPRRRLASLLRPWPRPLATVVATAAFLGRLREGGYDLALDLQGNLKSALIARASGARTVAGAGRGAAREGSHALLNLPLRLPTGPLHKVERNLALVGALLGRPAPYVAPDLGLRPEEVAAAQDALVRAGWGEPPPLVLHPGTSGFGSFKRWPVERFAALARRLASVRRPAAVTFGPAEEGLATAVARGSDGCARPLPTPSVRVLAALLARAPLVVAGDTGPLHLAAALGTPVLGLYGPKDPRVYGPYGPGPDGRAGLRPVVVQDDVGCRPCARRRCDAPLCLTTLEPDAVARACGAAGARVAPAPARG